MREVDAAGSAVAPALPAGPALFLPKKWRVGGNRVQTSLKAVMAERERLGRKARLQITGLFLLTEMVSV